MDGCFNYGSIDKHHPVGDTTHVPPAIVKEIQDMMGKHPGHGHGHEKDHGHEKPHHPEMHLPHLDLKHPDKLAHQIKDMGDKAKHQADKSMHLPNIDMKHIEKTIDQLNKKHPKVVLSDPGMEIKGDPTNDKTFDQTPRGKDIDPGFAVKVKSYDCDPHFEIKSEPYNCDPHFEIKSEPYDCDPHFEIKSKPFDYDPHFAIKTKPGSDIDPGFSIGTKKH